MKRYIKGFTFIELIIALAIIAVLSSIILVNIVSSKISANETTAITHLRLINLLETEIKVKGTIDQDGDTLGEYALMGEICGTVIPRTASGKVASLSNLYAPKAGMSYGEKDGFYFQIFLPSPSVVVTDNGVTNPNAVSANADVQEDSFRCYAWPVVAGKTGRRAFVIDQRGIVYATANVASGKSYYTGSTKTPAYNSATSGSDTSSFGRTITAGTGNDALVWYECN